MFAAVNYSQRLFDRNPSICFLVRIALYPEKLNFVNCFRGESSLNTLFYTYLHHFNIFLTFSAWLFLLHKSSMHRINLMLFWTTYWVSLTNEKFLYVNYLRYPWSRSNTFWGVSMIGPSSMLTECLSFFIIKSGS